MAGLLLWTIWFLYLIDNLTAELMILVDIIWMIKDDCIYKYIRYKLYIVSKYIRYIYQRRNREGGGGPPRAPPFCLQLLVFFCNHFEELQTVLFENLN